jgi:hypothetical protein
VGLTGISSDMLPEPRACIDGGVDHFALHFEPRDPDTLAHAVERFDHEVVRELGAWRRACVNFVLRVWQPA